MLYISYIPQMYENLIVSAQTNNKVTLPDVITVECLDSNLFTIILDALGNKKKVTFAKSLKELTPNDLVISEAPYFNSQAFQATLMSEANKFFSLIPQYTYFRYSFLNNIFLSKGFYLTEENREVIYVKIIESENEELIKYLEEYISIVNQLNKFEKLYQCYVNAIERMSLETDENVLQTILDEALTFFSSAEKQFLCVGADGWMSSFTGNRNEVKIPNVKDMSLEEINNSNALK